MKFKGRVAAMVALCLTFVGNPERLSLATPRALADPGLVCASVNRGYNYCPASLRTKVRLIEQLSSAPCVTGRSWGYDQRGIWVDRGCAARFVTAGGSSTGAIVGAAVVGGIVGALLSGGGNDRGTYSRYDNAYVTRSYRTIPDEPGYVTRQRARDIAAQADYERQRRDYIANQQKQRDIQATQDAQNDRAAAEERAAGEAAELR